MKILFIVHKFEGTAHGPIAKSIINEIAKSEQVDVLYKGELQKSDMPHVRKFFSCQAFSFMDYIHRRIERFLPFNPAADLWAIAAKRAVKDEKYDVVFSILSAWYYYPLYCGAAIAKQKCAKYAVYTLDAIPAPGWDYSERVKKFQRRLTSNKLKVCDYFAAINERMMEYQLTTFKNKVTLKKSVILIPLIEKRLQLPTSEEDVFLYTGGIYGDRKISYTLKAFTKYRNINNGAKLVLVGTGLTENFLQRLDKNIDLSNVELVDFTKDLSPYYKRAKVLLNIDPDVKNDVFLASKLLKYLNINRVILCETGEDSPTRDLMGNLNSVIQCSHDENELFRGMKRAIELTDSIDYSDRESLIKQLDPSFISGKVVKELNEVLKIKKII